MTYLIKYVSNKTEDLNIYVFNMITRKICRCNERKSNSDQRWNNDKC